LTVNFAEFEKEDDWIEIPWHEDEAEKFLVVNSFKTVSTNNKGLHPDSIYSINIRMSDKKEKFVRKSYNISEWLDETGGLLLAIEVFFATILVFFTSRCEKIENA